MPAEFTFISADEMQDFLKSLGYSLIDPTLPYMRGMKELVYGKVLKPNVCLRVYTSIDKYTLLCADLGEDAIRCIIVKRNNKADLNIKGVARTHRVHRVENWKANLEKRIKELEERFS